MLVGTMLRQRYKIIRELGSGGFGDTYIAEDMDLPNHPFCVVKHFHPKGLGSSGLSIAKRLFDTEAQALYRLGKRHDRIPELFAHFEEKQEFYLVQQYIEGVDLSHELKLGKQLNEAQVISLLESILDVLAFAHQEKIIHRDIKPTNLIRRKQDSKIVLLDFGAVKEIETQLSQTTKQTKYTVAIGTPGYMPSEQGSGKPKLSSDVYAVGIIGIQALTGLELENEQLPEHPQTGEILWRDKVQVSQGLANILDQMVRYDYRARYPSAVEALKAVRGLNPSVSTTVTPTKPVPIPPSQKQLVKRKPLMLSVLAVSLPIIGLGYAGFTLFQQDNVPSITPQETLKNYSTYTNQAEGISISYPSDWSKEEKPDPITNILVSFISPKVEGKDTFQENVSVIVEDLSTQPLTLNEYTEVAINEIEQFLVDAQILESSPMLLGKTPGFKVVYTGKRNDAELKFMQVWTVRNNKAYVVTYEAGINEYSQSTENTQKIVSSVEFE